MGRQFRHRLTPRTAHADQQRVAPGLHHYTTDLRQMFDGESETRMEWRRTERLFRRLRVGEIG